MSDEKPQCVVCGQTNEDIPLLALDYRGQAFYICPQHFPLLIHKPHLLVGKLPGVENLHPNQ